MAKYIAVYFVIFDKTPPDVEYLSIASIASVAALQLILDYSENVKVGIYIYI